MFLHEKLNFLQQIKEKTLKARGDIGVTSKIRHILARHSLILICKSFVTTHFDYCGIFYDQPNNEYFCNKLKRCNTTLLWQLPVPLEEYQKQIFTTK